MSPLPNPAMDFTAFDTLPAASLDDLVENIEALEDGSAPITAMSYATTNVANPYKFHAIQTAGQGPFNTATKITFTTELFDTNNNFTNSIYTIPTPGFYRPSAFVRTIPSGGDTSASLFLYKNGSPLYLIGFAAGTNLDRGLGNPIGLLEFAQGDTLEIFASSTGGNISTLASGTTVSHFSCELVYKT